MKTSTATTVVGCGYLLMMWAFWISVICVGVHFISKWW